MPPTFTLRSKPGSATETRTSIWAARWKTCSGRCDGKCRSDRLAVGDVRLHEACSTFEGSVEIRSLPRREVVDDEHVVAALDERINEVGADESGSAGDQGSHPGSLFVLVDSNSPWLSIRSQTCARPWVRPLPRPGRKPARNQPSSGPSGPEQGDYSTNAAMLLAPGLGEKPRDIAERLAGDLESRLGAGLDRLEVAGPGFVNLFLSDSWHRNGVASVLEAERFGESPPATPAVLLEFVSANPTGPLTAAGGRGAAYGDSLARVLEMAGHDVSREYYLNDAGTQIQTFGASIAARMAGDEPPADGYSGEYVTELAEELREAGADPNDVGELTRLGVERMRERIEETLERFRVHFDTWSSERELHLEQRAPEHAERFRGARSHLRIGRRPVAEDERMGRRQGPRSDPLGRRADLLRRRHRLSPRQARAGCGADDRAPWR